MARYKRIVEPVKVVEPTINNVENVKEKFSQNSIFSIENSQAIKRLSTVTHPTKEELDEIYNLYKLFINPNAKLPANSNCYTCGANNIVKYFFTLRDWYYANKDKFEQE